MIKNVRTTNYPGRQWSSTCTHIWTKGTGSRTWLLNGPPALSMGSRSTLRKTITLLSSERFSEMSVMKSSDSLLCMSKKPSEPYSDKFWKRNSQQNLSLILISTRSRWSTVWWMTGSGRESSPVCMMRQIAPHLRPHSERLCSGETVLVPQWVQLMVKNCQDRNSMLSLPIRIRISSCSLSLRS